MTETPLATRDTSRMILHAAARVLGCGSVQLALVDAERQALVISLSVSNRDIARVHRVESELGFQLEGAMLPLAVEASLLVRAFREERVLVSSDVADLTGPLIPEDALGRIREMIGPRSFAAVPIGGRSGTVGVLLTEKPGEGGYSAQDRDLLVVYADRVGRDLESQVLSDDARKLEALDDLLGAPPEIYLCDRELRLEGGRSLAEALDLETREIGEGTSIVMTRAGQRLRVTRRPGPSENVIVAVEDLQSRDRVRKEAARAREHLAKVLRSVADPILALDVDGRITSGNEAVERTFKWRATELIGRDAEELFADEKSRARASEMKREARARGFSQGELRLRRADGTMFAGDVSVLLMADEEERPAGMVARIHDLTLRRQGDAERRRLRARLLQSERLSALGEMAARIAHEVRNPLVSIGAAAQVVAEELDASSPVRGEVTAIAREVRRLDAIVTDFLRFARPRRADRRATDLVPVIEESASLARAKSAAHELRVRTEGPLVGRCDPDGIKQVLLNVMLNAIEAAPGGPVDCVGKVTKGKIVISIADHGPGVPESLRRRIFDPFFSTKTRGTGLGLSVSKQIIDEHAGRIRVFNRRGGGARVVIELPLG